MKFDTYTWQARVLPAALLMLPVFVATNLVLSYLNFNLGLSLPIANFILLSLLIVISIFCRDLGKNAEKKLFKKWGGPPTTRYLRIFNDEYNTFQKTVIKEYLKMHFNGIGMPTEKMEKEQAKEADAKYEAYIAELRAITRNYKEFAILQSDNRNYGMIRNLFGIKILAIVLNVAIILSAIIVMFCVKNLLNDNVYIISIVISGSMILFWLIFITEKRVKNAAENYAVQLFDAALKIKAGVTNESSH